MLPMLEPYLTRFNFSPEDATRTEKDFLLEAVQTAIDAGATIINIPDTVGYSNPTAYGELFAYLIANTKKQGTDYVFLPTVTMIWEWQRRMLWQLLRTEPLSVEGTINGIGERAGNTALEEVALALHVRQDFYDCTTNIQLGETKRTSDLVARLSGIAVPKNKTIVGGNAICT